MPDWFIRTILVTNKKAFPLYLDYLQVKEKHKEEDNQYFILKDKEYYDKR
jgi:hypothetical protein